MARRIHSIDIVRGLAATSVFLTHLGNPVENVPWLHSSISAYLRFFTYFFWCNGGLHAGVVVFIVLSGFCIHMPQALKPDAGLTIAYYARRRVFRIYPVMAVAMGLGLASVSAVSGEGLSNFFTNLALVPGLLNLPPPMGNEILITVIVECLLYGFYPLGLKWLKGRPWSWVILPGLCVYLANVLSLRWFPSDPTWVSRNFFALFMYWWIGAYAVRCAASRPRSRALSGYGCAILYLAYLAFCHLVHFKGAHVFKSLLLAVWTAYVLALTFRSAYTRETAAAPGKISGMFVGLGEKSYSLYVVHVPVLTILSHLMNSSTHVFYVSGILTVAVAALAFYYLIESPFHRLAIASSNRVLGRVA